MVTLWRGAMTPTITMHDINNEHLWKIIKMQAMWSTQRNWENRTCMQLYAWPVVFSFCNPSHTFIAPRLPRMYNHIYSIYALHDDRHARMYRTIYTVIPNEHFCMLFADRWSGTSVWLRNEKGIKRSVEVLNEVLNEVEDEHQLHGDS